MLPTATLHRFKGVLVFGTVLCMTGCVWMRDLPYRDRRRAADKAFEERHYVLAAARYESLKDHYPDTPMREDLVFRQGVALYSVTSYHEARGVFDEYLDEFPAGRYRSDAGGYIRKIDLLMSRATPAEAKKLEQARAKADLDVLTKLMEEHPTDWRVQEAIGDIHWKLGEYGKALDYYLEARRIASTYEERKLNNGRLILDDEGKPVPVNPEILKKMEVERHPVRVYDLHTYKARNLRSETGGDIQFYNLTGSLRNQGEHLLRNVQLQVVYKDIGGNVLDVDRVKIGTLGPGEVRSFLSTARNYDNLFNIIGQDVDVFWRD